MPEGDVDALFVLRGRPGLGHVSPGLAVARDLVARGAKVGIVSYGPGHTYLQEIDDFPFVLEKVEVSTEFREWGGLTLYDGGVSALGPILERLEPRLIVLGGEYMIPPAVAAAGTHVSLLLNPEILLKGDRNLRAARLFSYVFRACDSFVGLGPFPPGDRLIEAFLPIRERFLGSGPFPAHRALLEQTRRPGGRVVLIANGGGTEFPNDTSSYSSQANQASIWLEQTLEFTRAALEAAVDTEGADATICVFSSLPPQLNEGLRMSFLRDDRVTISEPSPNYYEVLAHADVVVSRSGLGFVNDLNMTGAGAVLWSLAGHEEQAENARRVVRERGNAVYVEKPHQISQAIREVSPERRPVQSAAELDNLHQVAAAYWELLHERNGASH